MFKGEKLTMNRRAILKGGVVLLAGGGAIGGSSLASFAADTVTLPIGNGERANRQISAETPDDRSYEPAAPARNTLFRI